ncbi:protein Aster-B-like isoform X3 [Leguminivora glycinivorella]|uniref:protein Aster-B-like isoform X3 n=1 Tax=Leguminivora glycinivorella TaxID=1035111 RepID=UPI00200D5C72|nr:protein Aster-B-like isoform X3 [Leguminivora glycinivorella]
MTTSELDSRNIAISMRKSVENLVISSQDAIGQSISQALTFSGVITQHTNQILQETKNLSRSPSPSLRNPDADQLENDKDGAPDSVSLGSASELSLPAAIALRSEQRVSSAGQRTSEGRTKKKSWYSSFYPTYKSKCEDFKRLFKDLPDEERLIVDYSCALQKDILVHGRLYASQNYLCFHASIFGWETSLSLRWKDVTAITKERTALVIPNAILICTETEKNFLTSFSGRDKSYLMLFRIWQNALMGQPVSSQEIWHWVHKCYGEELGFNSDDEGYSRDLPDPAVLPEIVDPPDTASEELAETSSMDAGGDRDESRERNQRVRDSSPTGTVRFAVGNGSGLGADGDALPTDMSDSSDSEPDKPHNGGGAEKCTNAHSGKVLLRQEFPFPIDQMFTMIFTNSKFNLELLAARGTTDYVQAPWQPAAGLKCRQVSYTLGLTSGPIGPKEVHVTETQVMNKCSCPGHLYSIDCTTENAGIPYADYFTVEVHYCLQRVAENSTSLQLFAYVRYKKTMWPMVKAFLEKNTMSGLDDFVRLLESRLLAEAEGAAPAKRKGRRTRRQTASSQEAAVAVVKPTTAILAPRASVSRPARQNSSWLVGILVLLLLLNALLYYRLYYSAPKAIDAAELQDRINSLSGAQLADWSALLEAHARRQRGQLLAWRRALDAARHHLAQTEQALKNLLETIKPTLEKDDDSPRTDL